MQARCVSSWRLLAMEFRLSSRPISRRVLSAKQSREWTLSISASLTRPTRPPDVKARSFGFALEDRNLPIAKRVFLTATPRHYDVRKKDKEGDKALVYSMDQPATYGPIVHTLSFAEAAKRGIICNYKIIISVVTSEMVNADLLSQGEVIVEGDVVRARTVANQIAIQKACEAHDLKKIFSFHRNVASARDFTGDTASSINGAFARLQRLPRQW